MRIVLVWHTANQSMNRYPSLNKSHGISMLIFDAKLGFYLALAFALMNKLSFGREKRPSCVLISPSSLKCELYFVILELSL